MSDNESKVDNGVPDGTGNGAAGDAANQNIKDTPRDEAVRQALQEEQSGPQFFTLPASRLHGELKFDLKVITFGMYPVVIALYNSVFGNVPDLFVPLVDDNGNPVLDDSGNPQMTFKPGYSYGKFLSTLAEGMITHHEQVYEVMSMITDTPVDDLKTGLEMAEGMLLFEACLGQLSPQDVSSFFMVIRRMAPMS